MEPKVAKKLLLRGFFLILFLVEYQGAAAEGSRTQNHSACNGSIAECSAEGELLMGSDISRMILEQQTHISYGALKRDQPACGSAGAGQPYRSCYPDPSNPYSRGCSKIYRCRGDS